MSRFLLRLAALGLTLVALAGTPVCDAGDSAKSGFPSPTVNEPIAASKSAQTAVVAGGCFWGIQAVFEHVKGVLSATSGYSGGAANTAQYDMVSTGETGHA